MLELIAHKIKINEELLAVIKDKQAKEKDLNKKYFYAGSINAFEMALKDLKEIQERAELDLYSVDHCLDALRGLK